MILAVGFRVRSRNGVLFRKWAGERLKEMGGGGYWKELLNRIRDIRASKKVFCRQVLDIYATSVDYAPKSPISIDFFKKVQNKIHYAVHGQTAAEVIYNRADAEKDFMGLTSFKGSGHISQMPLLLRITSRRKNYAHLDNWFPLIWILPKEKQNAMNS